MRICCKVLFPICWVEWLLMFHSVFQSFNKCSLEWPNMKGPPALIERDGLDVIIACLAGTALTICICSHVWESNIEVLKVLKQAGDLWHSTETYITIKSSFTPAPVNLFFCDLLGDAQWREGLFDPSSQGNSRGALQESFLDVIGKDGL